MTRAFLPIGAFAAVLAFGAADVRAQTYGDAPWCAVIELGSGEVHWDCEYRSVAECTPNVLAGNRGFCSPSPYYRAPAARVVSYPVRHRSHHVRHR